MKNFRTIIINSTGITTSSFNHQINLGFTPNKMTIKAYDLFMDGTLSNSLYIKCQSLTRDPLLILDETSSPNYGIDIKHRITSFSDNSLHTFTFYDKANAIYTPSSSTYIQLLIEFSE